MHPHETRVRRGTVPLHHRHQQHQQSTVSGGSGVMLGSRSRIPHVIFASEQAPAAECVLRNVIGAQHVVCGLFVGEGEDDGHLGGRSHGLSLCVWCGEPSPHVHDGRQGDGLHKRSQIMQTYRMTDVCDCT